MCRSEDNFQELLLSFHHVGPRGRPQVLAWLQETGSRKKDPDTNIFIWNLFSDGSAQHLCLFSLLFLMDFVCFHMYFIVYLFIYVCVYMSAVPAEARRWSRVPWNCSYRCL